MRSEPSDSCDFSVDWYITAIFTGNPTDPKIDKWLRSQDPRTELALRYSIRGRFMEAKTNAAFNARVDELFALLKPSEDELAAIMRQARELGEAIEGQIRPAPTVRRRR